MELVYRRLYYIWCKGNEELKEIALEVAKADKVEGERKENATESSSSTEVASSNSSGSLLSASSPISPVTAITPVTPTNRRTTQNITPDNTDDDNSNASVDVDTHDAPPKKRGNVMATAAQAGAVPDAPTPGRLGNLIAKFGGGIVRQPSRLGAEQRRLRSQQTIEADLRRVRLEGSDFAQGPQTAEVKDETKDPSQTKDQSEVETAAPNETTVPKPKDTLEVFDTLSIKRSLAEKQAKHDRSFVEEVLVPICQALLKSEHEYGLNQRSCADGAIAFMTTVLCGRTLADEDSEAAKESKKNCKYNNKLRFQAYNHHEDAVYRLAIDKNKLGCGNGGGSGPGLNRSFSKYVEEQGSKLDSTDFTRIIGKLFAIGKMTDEEIAEEAIEKLKNLDARYRAKYGTCKTNGGFLRQIYNDLHSNAGLERALRKERLKPTPMTAERKKLVDCAKAKADQLFKYGLNCLRGAFFEAFLSDFQHILDAEHERMVDAELRSRVMNCGANAVGKKVWDVYKNLKPETVKRRDKRPDYPSYYNAVNTRVGQSTFTFASLFGGPSNLQAQTSSMEDIDFDDDDSWKIVNSRVYIMV